MFNYTVNHRRWPGETCYEWPTPLLWTEVPSMVEDLAYQRGLFTLFFVPKLKFWCLHAWLRANIVYVPGIELLTLLEIGETSLRGSKCGTALNVSTLFNYWLYTSWKSGAAFAIMPCLPYMLRASVVNVIKYTTCINNSAAFHLSAKSGNWFAKARFTFMLSRLRGSSFLVHVQNPLS